MLSNCSLYLYMFSAVVKEMDKKQPRYQSEIQRKKLVYLKHIQCVLIMFNIMCTLQLSIHSNLQFRHTCL